MELFRMGQPDLGSIHALDVDGLLGTQEKELLDYPSSCDVHDGGMSFLSPHFRKQFRLIYHCRLHLSYNGIYRFRIAFRLMEIKNGETSTGVICLKYKKLF